MNIFDSIFLGIVEGITEFLPISSTGHLIIASKLLGITQSDFVGSFEIAIQLGAILAVVVIFWQRFFHDRETFKKICVAFFPTAIIGFVLYHSIKSVLLGDVKVVLWAFLVGGIVLIFCELFVKKKEPKINTLAEMTYQQSFIVGIAQSLAVIPGVSRSAATILGGLLQGINRTVIVEFSFLLAVPTIGAATFLDILKSYANFSFDQFYLLVIGCLIAFATAYGSVKWLLRFIQTHTFIPFGIYRILAAIFFASIFLGQ